MTKPNWRATPDDIAAIVEARHGDPFALLGPHDTQAGTVIRALVPGAQTVEDELDVIGYTKVIALTENDERDKNERHQSDHPLGQGDVSHPVGKRHGKGSRGREAG